MKYANERIFAEGFYDDNGTWFYTWERGRENECYNYGCADTFDIRPTHIRYDRYPRVHGEITIEEYNKSGLPD